MDAVFQTMYMVVHEKYQWHVVKWKNSNELKNWIDLVKELNWIELRFWEKMKELNWIIAVVEKNWIELEIGELCPSLAASLWTTVECTFIYLGSNHLLVVSTFDQKIIPIITVKICNNTLVYKCSINGVLLAIPH